MLVLWKFLLINNRNYKIILDTSLIDKTILNPGMEHLFIVRQKEPSNQERAVSIKIVLEKITEHNLKLSIKQIKTNQGPITDNIITLVSNKEEVPLKEEFYLFLECVAGDKYPVTFNTDQRQAQEYHISEKNPVQLRIVPNVLPSIQLTQDKLIIEKIQK